MLQTALMHAFMLVCLCLYAATAFWSLGHLFSPRVFGPRVLRILAFANLLLTFAFLTAFSFWRGHLPLGNLPEALFLLSWFILLPFVIMDFKYGMAGLAPLVMPMVFLIFLSASVLIGHQEGLDRQYHSGLVCAHITFAFASYACFVLALWASVAYLIRDWELKGKRRLRFTRILPPLEKLDFIAHEVLLIGFPLLTLALILGALAQAIHGLLGPRWFADWRVATAAATWIMYAILIALRLAWNRRGRGIAALTVVAFCVVVVSFVIFRAMQSKHEFSSTTRENKVSSSASIVLYEPEGVRRPWK